MVPKRSDPSRPKARRDAKARTPRGPRASTDVVEQISRAVFAGQRSGDWIGTESELTKRFGVSRTTVRDSVRELEACGLLEVRVGAHGGVRVAQPDPQRVVRALEVQLHLLGISWEEVSEVRRAIEPATAAMAARRATDEQIAELRELLSEARAVALDPEASVDMGMRFHLAIAEVAGNRPLQMVLSALRQVQRSRFVPTWSPEASRHVAANHEGILEALAARDEPLVRERMAAHLDYVLAFDEDVLQRLAAQVAARRELHAPS